MTMLDVKDLVEYVLPFDDGRSVRVYQDPTGLVSAGIGATVWDCALVTAKFLEQEWQSCAQTTTFVESNRHTLKRKSLIEAFNPRPSPKDPCRVLEVGSGTGLVGLTFWTLCHQALPHLHLDLTDQSCAIPLLAHNTFSLYPQSESSQLRVFEWNWTDAKPEQALPQYDLILVSDAVHWPHLFEPLVQLLHAQSHRGTQIIVAYERRVFETEVEFFRVFGRLFLFQPVPVERQHPEWRSGDDIYLFMARLREDVSVAEGVQKGVE